MELLVKSCTVPQENVVKILPLLPLIPAVNPGVQNSFHFFILTGSFGKGQTSHCASLLIFLSACPVQRGCCSCPQVTERTGSILPMALRTLKLLLHFHSEVFWILGPTCSITL